MRVRLTAAGRKAFERMAREHEAWVVEFFAGLDAEPKHALYDALGQLRVQLAADPPGRSGPTASAPEPGG